jgi:hypothetical protein
MELKKEQNNEYGIEPEKLYPGSAILEILTAVNEELDQAVDEAYAEGYKAASLRFVPEVEVLKVELQIEKQKGKNKIRDMFTVGVGGVAFGFLSFFAISTLQR